MKSFLFKVNKNHEYFNTSPKLSPPSGYKFSRFVNQRLRDFLFESYNLAISSFFELEICSLHANRAKILSTMPRFLRAIEFAICPRAGPMCTGKVHIIVISQRFFVRIQLNVGTVPRFKMHHVGTVPTFKMHNVGTVPTFKKDVDSVTRMESFKRPKTLQIGEF